MPKYKDVDEYIVKQPPVQREICNELRKIILNTVPGITEEMKWGVPTYDGGRFYIGSFKKNVNLGFAVKGLSDKELKLFEGTGNTMRHIKVYKPETINENQIVKLLTMVKNKNAKLEHM